MYKLYIFYTGLFYRQRKLDLQHIAMTINLCRLFFLIFFNKRLFLNFKLIKKKIWSNKPNTI